MKPQKTGFRRLAGATRASIAGLKAAWQDEAAFRQELVVTILLTPAAVWLGSSPVERLLLIGSCWLVIVVELVNSGIESAVDRSGTEYDPLAGKAKDLGSAAVFVSLGLVLLTWLVIGWQRFSGSGAPV